LLDPTLYELVVQRKMGYKENEPEFKELISRYTEDANILKKLCAAAMNKTLFDFQNQQWDPLKILSNPYMLMEFLAMGYPAWMDRGPCHISMMVAETGITVPDYFMAPHALLGKLNEFIHIETSPILHENYTLGIVVFPEHMSAFAHFFEQHRNIFESYLLKNGWSQQGADCTLLKINEAIIYCLMSQSIFVESTDIFSAPLGIIT
jgi:hypothetical protein